HASTIEALEYHRFQRRPRGDQELPRIRVPCAQPALRDPLTSAENKRDLNMSRFYFHFRENDDYSVDDQGLEFASAEEAYLNAHEGAVEMWSDLLKQRRDPRQCAIEITNSKGEVLFVLPFNEVLESCNRKTPPRPRMGAGSNYPAMLEARRLALKSIE